MHLSEEDEALENQLVNQCEHLLQVAESNTLSTPMKASIPGRGECRADAESPENESNSCEQLFDFLMGAHLALDVQGFSEATNQCAQFVAPTDTDGVQVDEQDEQNEQGGAIANGEENTESNGVTTGAGVMDNSFASNDLPPTQMPSAFTPVTPVNLNKSFDFENKSPLALSISYLSNSFSLLFFFQFFSLYIYSSLLNQSYFQTETNKDACDFSSLIRIFSEKCFYLKEN